MSDHIQENERLRRKLEEVQREWKEVQREWKEVQREQEAAKARAENQQQTTFDEYLRYCHQYLFKSLKIQRISQSTAGGTTDVTDKCYPLSLRSWKGFIDKQQRHYIITQDILQDERLLPSQLGVVEMGKTTCKRPLASEEDLKIFEHLALEYPVENIISLVGLRSSTLPIGQELDCAAVSFENQPHSLIESGPGEGEDEIFDEDIKRPRGQSGPEEIARNQKTSTKVGPDSWCFYTNHCGAKKIAFPVEYKAAHKVPVEGLRQALRNEDLFTRVISRNSSGRLSTDKEVRLQDKMEETVAKALTQIFHYMVRVDTAYGYLTTGTSLIFLWVRDDDPRVLYHYMLEPERDAEGDDGSRVVPFYTAVAQLATFCLWACQPPKRPKGWSEDAMSLLKRWPQPYNEMEIPTTDDEGSTEATRSTSSYVDPTERLPRPGRSSCKDAETIRKDDDDGDDDDGDARDGEGPHGYGLVPATRTSKKRKGVSSGSDNFEGAETSSGQEHEARQYCTQGCLLGLKRRHPLDENCPNVSLHRASGSGSQHPIDVAELARLTHAQLGRRLGRHCEPLDGYGKYGARGALFRLTLPQYGYTFVGKGTFAAAVRHLRHEGRVYERLERLQGEVVPVYLGNIDLERPYYLIAADIVHMLLMSWAGEEAATAGVANLAAETERSIQAVLSEGVQHNDLRAANMVWNPERCCVMLIDFDQATLPTPYQHRQVLKWSRKKRNRREDKPLGSRAAT
ncbi:hypothetical protein QQX98_007920 [Neonectria punicea]|uniref:Protein kinase domain-containing protein n=1 Tax=Neonectria punicea TaxID=979145 RepID=A0ABR1GWL5_9HYPO